MTDALYLTVSPRADIRWPIYSNSLQRPNTGMAACIRKAYFGYHLPSADCTTRSGYLLSNAGCASTSDWSWEKKLSVQNPSAEPAWQTRWPIESPQGHQKSLKFKLAVQLPVALYVAYEDCKALLERLLRPILRWYDRVPRYARFEWRENSRESHQVMLCRTYGHLDEFHCQQAGKPV